MPNYYIEAYKTVPADYVSYDQMVQYVNDYCNVSGVTTSGVTYQEMVDYVDQYCTCSGATISGAQLDELYAYITTVSGRITCWEDFFLGLQNFDDITFDYPTPSGTISGTHYWDGGTFG